MIADNSTLSADKKLYSFRFLIDSFLIRFQSILKNQ